MTTRSKGAMAGFGWLKRGIGVGFRHPKLLSGATASLLLALIIPTLVQALLEFRLLRTGTQPTMTAFALVMVAPLLLSLLILPLYAGYMQVIDAAERGIGARARDIFKPYRQANALDLIGYGLALMVIYLVLIGLIVIVTAGDLPGWYLQILAAQANHQPPPTALPAGFVLAMAMVAVAAIFMMGVYAISLGQVALGQRSVFGAIGDGFVGASRNVLPLLMFAVSIVLGWIAFAVVVMLFALLLALIAKFVGAWLMLVMVVPLYIALLLVLISGMFGVMYHLWRDVCGDGETTAVTDLPLTA